ncbi:MAG: 16S rRNA (adenine(1518)-N(6)/adenine(1519)-N(6))-dimethyltransferase RsmA [Acidobacteriota bacterium]
MAGNSRSPAHRRRKALGQHFLVQPAAIRRILDILEISAHDRILEIGPGLGALTMGLADRCEALLAVEVDPGLAERLGTRLSGKRSVRLITGDILRLDPAALLRTLRGATRNRRIRVVGNLPYRISTAVLQKYLEPIGKVSDYHFMFQKEVAERLAALPRTPAYGYISVLAQIHCQVKILMRVSPGSFRPPPLVDSALVGLYPRPRRPWRTTVREERFRSFLRIAFANRRKTLANNLRHGAGWKPEKIGTFLEKQGLSPVVRAEELSPAAFLRLFSGLK